MSEPTFIDVTPPASSPRARSGTFGELWLLARRRMWRDRWLVVSSVIIVAFAAALSLSGPELVARTVDNGAADVVTAAGADGDIVVATQVGNVSGDNVSSIRGIDVGSFEELGATVVTNLPPRTASVVKNYESWVLANQMPFGSSATAQEVADQKENGGDLVRHPRVGDYLQFGYSPQAELTLVEGSLPQDPPSAPAPQGTTVPPTQIALSQEVADALELGIGDLARVNTSGGMALDLEVSGIVAAKDPAAEIWERFPEFSAPFLSKNAAGGGARRGTVMVSQATLDSMTRSLRTPFAGYVDISIDPDVMTLALARAIPRELRSLQTSANNLLGANAGVNVKVTTGLEQPLEEYPLRARAAVAQLSIIIAGVVSVAAVVIALMASLLLTRREADISLERARGSSVLSTALRLLLESFLVTALGLALGIAAALVITPSVSTASGLLRAVALVALLSSPVSGALAARRMWTGKREPANRQDRAKLAKARKARRLTLEVLAIVIAAFAVVSLRGRSVLQTTTEGIDPFLAATPVLVALAVVVVVVRLYPIPMRIIQFFAKRTRGVSGVITLAKTREAIPVLPLLGLTLAIAVAVSGGLLVSSVQEAQQEASWDRVGADVRIDSAVTYAQEKSLKSQGLTVSRGLTKPKASLSFGNEYGTGFLLAMDESFPTILTMAGVEDVSSLQKMYKAAENVAPGDPIPSLASVKLMDADVHETASVYLGRTYVPIDIIGEATVTPEGWAGPGPYLLMPADQLLSMPFEQSVDTNIAFVSGPHAAELVAAETQIDQSTVTTREEWLAGMRASALGGGVERAIGIAVLAVGLLAAMALLVTILRGVRERGRALSMLRTQGMGFRYGWWLALAELAPLTLAAVIGGAIGGLAILWLLGDSLGLKLLSGGLMNPPVVPNWTFMAVLGGGILVLLFLAVAVEVLAHRRNKLSEVLRWGESR